MNKTSLRKSGVLRIETIFTWSLAGVFSLHFFPHADSLVSDNTTFQYFCVVFLFSEQLGAVLQGVEYQGPGNNGKMLQSSSQGHICWDPLMFQFFFIILFTFPLPTKAWCWSQVLSLDYSGRFFFFFKFRKTFAPLVVKDRLRLAIWLSSFCLTPSLLIKKGYFSLCVLHFDSYTNGLFWILELLRSLTSSQLLLNYDYPLLVKCTKRDRTPHQWLQVIVFSWGLLKHG